MNNQTTPCRLSTNCSWITKWPLVNFVCLMVFYVTFNNISAISWRSVLLVEETGGPGENHRPVTSHWQTLLQNVVHLALIDIRTHISGDRHWLHIGSCKCNYHTITVTTAPDPQLMFKNKRSHYFTCSN
jgi:hypothetical protein